MHRTRLWVAALLLAAASAASGQSFGTVVALGGHSSDLVLDEARGYVYVANYTANRIDVVNLTTKSLERSMNVASQPSSIALSPDGRYLLVAHYGNFVSPSTPKKRADID